MRTLYRAFAYIVGSQDDSEVVVFFEAGSDAAASGTLLAMLATVWRMPADRIDSYNLHAEHELLGSWALGDESTGDARLLEIGAGPDGVRYAEPERTLMLVRPRALRRLVAAQRQARTSPLAA